MLRQGKMKHNKEQFEYPKSIVIPCCEGEYLPPITVDYPLSMHERVSELDVGCLNNNMEDLRVHHYSI